MITRFFLQNKPRSILGYVSVVIKEKILWLQRRISSGFPIRVLVLTVQLFSDSKRLPTIRKGNWTRHSFDRYARNWKSIMTSIAVMTPMKSQLLIRHVCVCIGLYSRISFTENIAFSKLSHFLMALKRKKRWLTGSVVTMFGGCCDGSFWVASKQ